jgi:hypothetical protein
VPDNGRRNPISHSKKEEEKGPRARWNMPRVFSNILGSDKERVLGNYE